MNRREWLRTASMLPLVSMVSNAFAADKIRKHSKSPMQAQVHGRCDKKFAAIREILTASLSAGDDLGASVALTIDGKSVIDIWGGWSDAAKTLPWNTDTVTNVWSTTKTMTSLCALTLIDRGQLDPYAPVSHYWPEFAANGKEKIEVRHLMSHTSGVAGWAQPVTLADVYDREKSTAMLAAQAPWWEPGAASGYHLLNQGHLVGEVVRRVSDKTLTHFFADEIAGPLDADFQIGLKPADDHRASPVIPPPPLPFDFSKLGPDSVAFKALTGPVVDASVANTMPWRRAEIGAANGHGNARSVARIHTMISNGGMIDGRRLLSPDTIKLIFDQQSNGIDLVLGIPLRFGIGYCLPCAAVPVLPDARICFWGGYGGSMIVNDLDRRMTFSYVMNKMGPGIIGGPRSDALIRAVYAALA